MRYFIVLLSKEYKDTDVISFFKDLKNFQLTSKECKFTTFINSNNVKFLEDDILKYGKENIISALDANMHLFTRLAKMVGESQKFDFPEKRVDKLINWVRTNYKDRG